MAAASVGAALAGGLALPGQAAAANPCWLSVTDFGALGNGSANDGPAIQAAIRALGSKGGTLLFPPGTYLCTSDVAYAINSRAGNGSLKLQGAGRDVSTIRFQGSNLIDGRWANWNTGYTELIVQDLSLRFAGANGKGYWVGAVTLPQLYNVTLSVNGTYADGATVLLGSGPGPVGVTAHFSNVTYEPQWGAGSNVTGICIHFDSFVWDGGGITTGFPATLVDPRLLWLQPVFTYRLRNLVPYVPSTDARKTFALLNQSESSGSTVFESCGWYRSSWNYHLKAVSGNPNVYVYHCSVSDLPWPLKTSGSFGKVVYRDNPGYV
jgi:hypothetical protein